MSTDEIVREYPDLEPEDVRQALSYASVLAIEEVHPFTSPAAPPFVSNAVCSKHGD
jgi:hypothetical protein